MCFFVFCSIQINEIKIVKWLYFGQEWSHSHLWLFPGWCRGSPPPQWKSRWWTCLEDPLGLNCKFSIRMSILNLVKKEWIFGWKIWLRFCLMKGIAFNVWKSYCGGTDLIRTLWMHKQGQEPGLVLPGACWRHLLRGYLFSLQKKSQEFKNGKLIKVWWFYTPTLLALNLWDMMVSGIDQRWKCSKTIVASFHLYIIKQLLVLHQGRVLDSHSLNMIHWGQGCKIWVRVVHLVVLRTPYLAHRRCLVIIC